jgi:hypothetical protein
MNTRRWLLGWLLFALVGAQALGFMHRVTHGPHTAGAAALAHATALGEQHGPGASQRAGWTADLFAGHADDSGCRLFDAVGHDGMPLPPIAAVVLRLACSGPADFATASFAARRLAPFQARAPPLSR